MELVKNQSLLLQWGENNVSRRKSRKNKTNTKIRRNATKTKHNLRTRWTNRPSPRPTTRNQHNQTPTQHTRHKRNHTQTIRTMKI